MRPPLASMANVVDAFIEGGIGSDLWRFKCLVNSVAGPTVIELKCRFKSDVLSPVWGVADWTCRQDCMFRIVPMWGGRWDSLDRVDRKSVVKGKRVEMRE